MMKAVLFPGQGAQYTGMGKSLCDGFPQAEGVFAALDETLGFKLSEKCFQADATELKDTSLQQLAILAVSLAAFEAFRSRVDCSSVSYLSGLSLGEYSCLYPAGVISLADLALLVRERAAAMQKAAQATSATMLAVLGLPRAVVEEEAKKGRFYVANINSPAQIVVSVAKADAAGVLAELARKGAKVIELEVSGGFHSPFMEEARRRLADTLAGIPFRDAGIPIVSNVTARPHTKADEIKANLLAQLTVPVLWNDCVDFMCERGVGTFYEVGPSKVLRGLMRKINPNIEVINIEKKEDIEALQAGGRNL